MATLARIINGRDFETGPFECALGRVPAGVFWGASSLESLGFVEFVGFGYQRRPVSVSFRQPYEQVVTFPTTWRLGGPCLPTHAVIVALEGGSGVPLVAVEWDTMSSISDKITVRWSCVGGPGEWLHITGMKDNSP